jgi:hypothetical protein
MNITPLHARAALAGVLITGTLLLAACGDDGVDADAPIDTAVESSVDSSVAADDAAADVVEVRAVDFGYGGLPAQVTPGTSLRLVNDSQTELHELVVFRLADGDDRPIADVVRDDLEAVLTGGPPAMVLLAAPGGAEQIVAVGDGTLTEPGRYAIICMIPTGADPAEYLAAAAQAQDGPPQVAGGAPHIAHGMFAEITVA